MAGFCFAFRFSTAYRLAGVAFGVVPATCEVRLNSGHLVARFGLWHAEVAFKNIIGVSVTGPFRFDKPAGPPHLTFSDRGLTFATNGDRGVFIESQVPFRGIEPLGVLRHPNLTVTVAECDARTAALRRR